MNIFQGKEELIEQPQERKYDGSKGWITSRRWQGTIDAVNSHAANLVREFGSKCSLSIQPSAAGLATISASFDSIQDGANPAEAEAGNPVTDSESWTLTGNDLSKSIFASPPLLALLFLYPDDYEWLRVNLPIAKKNGTWQSIYAALTGNEAGGALKPIFRIFMDGAEEYSISQFVLKLSRSFSSSAAGQVSLDNAGRQYSTAELIAQENVPADLIFALPEGAWLKRTPTIGYDGSKTSFDVEWWHSDSWSLILYPAFNAAPRPPLLRVDSIEQSGSLTWQFNCRTQYSPDPITSRGVTCTREWPPVIDDDEEVNLTDVATGIGAYSFPSNTGFLASTKYYVAAWCVTSQGTFRSPPKTFTTPAL